ncbi:MAG: hypothetical protein ABI359_01290 [Ginsengibacter sp.]
MINPAEIIHLSKQAFWDVDMDKLDYEKNADYIIAKVFDNGSMEDIMEITAWYGDDKVAKALMDAPYLKEITMVLASKLFNIPISSFKCSTTKQYHPIS